LSNSPLRSPHGKQDDGEETLDIDMTLSMAPGATILNYEGNGDDVFNRIASDNLAKQITLSYGFGIDETIVQDFMEFVAQGQSFFQASGDGGADLPGGTGLTGMPYATIVGGTSLTTASGGGAWISETTWNGSGGGVSGYGMPNWQQGVSMSANLGSTVSRNYPDVAMVADVVIWWYFKNGQGSTVGGTSASSPQWAGFMALVNQTSVAQTGQTVGFLNPAIYAIGECVQHRGKTFGLVAPLLEQARVCATYLAERGTRGYRTSQPSTQLKVSGIQVFSAGNHHAGPGSESLVLRDPKRGIYKRLVIEQDKIRGAVLYGDVRDGGWYLDLMNEGRNIGALRDQLLFGAPRPQ